MLLRLRCPVEGCLGGASNRSNLPVHFAHRHVRDTIVILEEGNRPYPRCPKCDVSVSHKPLNGRKRRRLAEEEARAGTVTETTAYGTPLTPVPSFEYLGRVMSASDDEWTAVVRNLRKSR